MRPANITPCLTAGACALLGLGMIFAEPGIQLAGGATRTVSPAQTQAGGEIPAASAQPVERQLAPSGQTPSPKPAGLTAEERADIFMARKSYADAVEYYTRALRQSGRADPQVWNKLGIAYQQLPDFRRARKAYNEAIRHRKNFPEPWNNLGTIYFFDKKYRKSVKCYEQAIQMNPASAAYHLNLGTSLYHLKKIPEALHEYRRALELDPNCLTGFSLTGTVIQAPRLDVEFYFYMAKVFASMGRVEEAVRYLRRAFEDGLVDHKRVEEDPDFQKISGQPAFVELMKNPPVAIKD